MSDDRDDDIGLSEEQVEIFMMLLETEGVAASTVEDGVVVAFQTGKLQELIEISEESEEGHVIIFISKKPSKPEFAN